MMDIENVVDAFEVHGRVDYDDDEETAYLALTLNGERFLVELPLAKELVNSITELLNRMEAKHATKENRP